MAKATVITKIADKIEKKGYISKNARKILAYEPEENKPVKRKKMTKGD